MRPGLEVLLSDSLHLVKGRRVGLVTNQSGVDHAGKSGVDRLLEAGVRVTALFSPEHGFRGTADPGAAVQSNESTVDWAAVGAGIGIGGVFALLVAGLLSMRRPQGGEPVRA